MHVRPYYRRNRRVPSLILAGGIALGLGAWALWGGASYSASRRTIDNGPLQVWVTDRQAVPAWPGVAAMAAGVLLVGAGLRGRRPGLGQR